MAYGITWVNRNKDKGKIRRKESDLANFDDKSMSV